MFEASLFRARRESLLERIGPSVAVFFSTPLATRNSDVEHEFRQDSDLFYLSGFDEPESVLVVTSVHETHRSVLFVRPKDPSREIWDGPRAGTEGAVRDFGVDASYPISELASRLPDYLVGAARVVYGAGVFPENDAVFFDALRKAKVKHRLGFVVPSEIAFPATTVHEMRFQKDEPELSAMRKAAAITREAHLRAMSVARPGVFEHEVEAEILRAFRRNGAERPAYGSIVGSGPNATILHYRKNDRRMEDGELLLIDAGAEYAYYACDVTRTFPVSGRFSEPQRILYELVLDAQRAAIEAIAPGVPRSRVHDAAVRVLTEGMVACGLLDGEPNELIETGAFKKYYMHGTSHWLGMDVHDVGALFVAGESRPLEVGAVLTVEPGIYVGKEADCDPKWRGIGIRIEDDLLVTKTGSENLTSAIPKSVAELESFLSNR